MTYPHCNGFLDQSTAVLGTHDGGTFRLIVAPVHSPRRPDGLRQLAQIPAGKPLWFDIALSAPVAAVVAGDEVLLVDLIHDDVRRVYTVAKGKRSSELSSIDRAGRRILICERELASDQSRLVAFDVATGEATTLVQHDWWINHAHFSPHDEDWIGYCHEGATEVPDRVWAWHPVHAPLGRSVFDQRAAADDPLRPLYVGHERLGFARTSAFVVAYGVSPGGPRGLYEVFPQPGGPPPRFVSGGDGDWHCDVSRDGRFAVVDTAGAHALPDGTQVDGSGGSDILLIETATGRRHLLGRARALSHPYHPHPVFSPDASAVLFNDAYMDDGQVRAAVRVVPLSVACDRGS